MAYLPAGKFWRSYGVSKIKGDVRMNTYRIKVNLKKLDNSIDDFIEKLKNNDGPLDTLANWESAIGNAIDDGGAYEITFRLESLEERYTLANELKLAGFKKITLITEEEV